MSNIVERLRDAAALPTGLYAEAAAEIERLESAFAAIRSAKANNDAHLDHYYAEVRKLREARDELLAALRWIDRWLGHKTIAECSKVVRDAIARFQED
jgi:hypothetical protein